ncbi:MAG: ABC transporter permease, partial [Anaerolineales bacterium]
MATVTKEIENITFHRTRMGYGITLIAFSLLIFFAFGLNTQAGTQTKFGMNLAGSQAIPISDLVVPSQAVVYGCAFILAFLGAFQLARGIPYTGLLVGAIALAFVTAFLTWAAADKSFNLVGMLNTSLVRATPIALAALCGVISERSAVINIGIEGIMLLAAQAAVVIGTVTGNLYLGLLSALIIGGLIAALHAFLVIRFKVDQIVSGVAINIIGAGVTSFASSRFLEKNTNALNNSGTFPVVSIPLLSKIPVIGPVLFENNIIVYLTILLVIIVHIVLFYTPWGLRTRAVGEHPKAADTLGVNVYLTRYINVILGGI